MIKCEICGKECKNLNGLGSHLAKKLSQDGHPSSFQEYYDKFLKTSETQGICNNENCNNKTKLTSIPQGYKKYCSLQCSNSDKNLIKIIKEKRKQTMLKKFGVEYASQNKELKEKQIQTNIKKYGTKYSIQNKKIKEKQIKTMLKKYDVKYPLQNKKIKRKQEKTNLKKFGVKHPLQNKKIKRKQEKII